MCMPLKRLPQRSMNSATTFFCAKKGEVESHQLPPGKDCLTKHAQRANYQARLVYGEDGWNRNQNAPPVGAEIQCTTSWWCTGWKGSQLLVPSWIFWPVTVQKRVLYQDVYVCVANGLWCTDMCRLAECENQAFTSDSEESSDEDVEDLENFDNY